jgi:hypothetical protein
MKTSYVDMFGGTRDDDLYLWSDLFAARMPTSMPFVSAIAERERPVVVPASVIAAVDLALAAPALSTVETHELEQLAARPTKRTRMRHGLTRKLFTAGLVELDGLAVQHRLLLQAVAFAKIHGDDAITFGRVRMLLEGAPTSDAPEALVLRGARWVQLVAPVWSP